MPALTLLVTADPSSSYLKPLERLPAGTRVIVSNQKDQLFAAAPEADVLLHGDFRDAHLFLETFPHATKVRWVHVLSAGIERQLSPEIIASPVPMTNGRGVFSRPLGEWVIGAMIYFTFDVPRMLRQQRAGIWEAFAHPELYGRAVAIVGYGDIGQTVGARAESFGMQVTPIRSKTSPQDLMNAIKGADYIVVTAPLTPTTRGLIGENQIAAMKPDAVVINIGRGPVIHEASLLAALQANKIRGAALDVFTVEPLPAGHAFYKLQNVLLSPHSADHTSGWRDLAVKFFLENFARFAKGEPLENVVDKHAGY